MKSMYSQDRKQLIRTYLQLEEDGKRRMDWIEQDWDLEVSSNGVDWKQSIRMYLQQGNDRERYSDELERSW